MDGHLYASCLFLKLAISAFAPELNRSGCADDKTKHFGPTVFDEVLKFLEANPQCANNRAYGPTGWTLLHQAAYWRADATVLRRMRAVGANPWLPAQNYQQIKKGQLGLPPLEIPNEGDKPKDRAKWQASFLEVFGPAPTPAASEKPSTPQDAEPEPELEPEPEPAAEPEAEAEPEPAAASTVGFDTSVMFGEPEPGYEGLTREASAEALAAGAFAPPS